MPSIPSFDGTHLEAVCQVLGETDGGLTGTQIGRYLHDCVIPDLQPSLSKRHRLFEALRAKQRQDHCANNVVAFIKKVMSPALFHATQERYDVFRAKLNNPLAFCGYQVNERGDVVLISAANPCRGRTIWLESDRRCHICSKPWNFMQRGRKGWHVDHVIANCGGGRDTEMLDNFKVACASCNLRKGRGYITRTIRVTIRNLFN